MRQRSGFTLVELSIVLVIIGLLIGGILAAQSMISTAKINAQVRQIGQFDAAVMNFKTLYNYLPGDAPMFGGDGDGVIDTTAGCGYDDFADSTTCEIANFWSSLFPGQYSSSACGAFGPDVVITGTGRNFPVATIGKNNSFIVALPMTTGNYYNADKVNPRHFYTIMDPSQQTRVDVWHHWVQTSSANSAVKPNDALALDAKIDDGLADSGYVLSGAIGNRGDGYGGIKATGLATCSSGATYQVQNTGYECTPLIRIGGSVGVPQ